MCNSSSASVSPDNSLWYHKSALITSFLHLRNYCWNTLHFKVIFVLRIIKILTTVYFNLNAKTVPFFVFDWSRIFEDNLNTIVKVKEKLEEFPRIWTTNLELFTEINKQVIKAVLSNRHETKSIICFRVEKVKEFCYLPSVITKHERISEDKNSNRKTKRRKTY